MTHTTVHNPDQVPPDVKHAAHVREALLLILKSYAKHYRIHGQRELDAIRVKIIPHEPIRDGIGSGVVQKADGSSYTVSNYDVYYDPASPPPSKEAAVFFMTVERALMKASCCKHLQDEDGKPLKLPFMGKITRKALFPLGVALAPKEEPQCLFKFSLRNKPDGSPDTDALDIALSGIRHALRKPLDPQTIKELTAEGSGRFGGAVR